MISGAERRDKIIEILNEASKPISATALASMFDVSRQIVVGDVALIRAQGISINATPRGYVIAKENDSYRHTIACIHDYDGMLLELNTIVDMGCKVIDVIVEHPVYGQISGQLELSTRADVDEFVDRVNKEKAHSLSELTDGVHLHTVECPDKATFEDLCSELSKMGLIFAQKGE